MLVRLVIKPCDQTLQLNYDKRGNYPVSSAYYLPINQPYGAQSADPVAQFAVIYRVAQHRKIFASILRQ